MNKFLEKPTNFCVSLVKNYLPDSFIFAVLLTFVVFIVVLPATHSSPVAVVDAWYAGFWSLLSFTMQMALILVCGTILATNDVAKSVLQAIASLAKNPSSAVILVTLIALLASFINWGFGLVIGAIFAKEVAKKVKGVHYPLLVASAYTGFIIWHAGLAGSIPLTLASASNLAAVTNGVISSPIATSETIFSFFNLAIVLVLTITLPFLLSFMHPNKHETIEVDKNLFTDENKQEEIFDRKNATFAEKLENAKWINILLGILGFTLIISYFVNKGFALNLNIINFIFLFTAIVLHKTPIKLVRAVKDAVKNVGGILLQFPFYAGIMGMMTFKGADGLSLASIISDFFVSISSEGSFAFFSFISAGIVNIFVPSGGGQWVVQAPIMMPAGAELGVDAAKTAMAIAWGDAWTNMIQPFWALPLLAIAGLGARDIMGYCLIVLVYSGVIISLGLTFL